MLIELTPLVSWSKMIAKPTSSFNVIDYYHVPKSANCRLKFVKIMFKMQPIQPVQIPSRVFHTQHLWAVPCQYYCQAKDEHCLV